MPCHLPVLFIRLVTGLHWGEMSKAALYSLLGRTLLMEKRHFTHYKTEPFWSQTRAVKGAKRHFA